MWIGGSWEVALATAANWVLFKALHSWASFIPLNNPSTKLNFLEAITEDQKQDCRIAGMTLEAVLCHHHISYLEVLLTGPEKGCLS